MSILGETPAFPHTSSLLKFFRGHSYFCKWKLSFSMELVVPLTKWRKPQNPQTLLMTAYPFMSQKKLYSLSRALQQGLFYWFWKMNELNVTNKYVLNMQQPQKTYRLRLGLQYLLSWRMHWHLTKSPEAAFNLHKGDQISFPLICLKAGWDSQIHLFKQMLVRQIYTGKSLGDW